MFYYKTMIKMLFLVVYVDKNKKSDIIRACLK